MIYFLLFGRGRGPRPHSKKKGEKKKKKSATAQTAKQITHPAPWERFFAVWAGGRVIFLLFGRGAYCFRLLFGRVVVFSFCFSSFFSVWAGANVFFSFFCCLGAGGEGAGVA